jgi:hypothetical protein
MTSRIGRTRKRTRAGLAIALVAAGFAALSTAPMAQAGLLVASADGCPTASLEKPFTRWLDVNDYFLAPNGGFENGASHWSLDGASVVGGNEPYYVHGAGESKSLSIPSGASATSDTACVGLNEPTARLFVKSSSASLLSRLNVEVLYEDAFGNTRSAPIGSVPAVGATSWTPSLPMVIGVNLLALVGDQTPVEFRFTAQGSANWQIDDVYVDPRHY